MDRDYDERMQPRNERLVSETYRNQTRLGADGPVKGAAPANERQIGGDHYGQGGSNWQHWDLVARMGLDYFVGCATKYVARSRFKGQGVQDLEKALHYLDKRTELGIAPTATPVDLGDLLHFCYMNNLNAAEMRALRLIIGWDFEEARMAILELRDRLGPEVTAAAGANAQR